MKAQAVLGISAGEISAQYQSVKMVKLEHVQEKLMKMIVLSLSVLSVRNQHVWIMRDYMIQAEKMLMVVRYSYV